MKINIKLIEEKFTLYPSRTIFEYFLPARDTHSHNNALSFFLNKIDINIRFFHIKHLERIYVQIMIVYFK